MEGPIRHWSFEQKIQQSAKHSSVDTLTLVLWTVYTPCRGSKPKIPRKSPFVSSAEILNRIVDMLVLVRILAGAIAFGLPLVTVFSALGVALLHPDPTRDFRPTDDPQHGFRSTCPHHRLELPWMR